MSDYQIRGYDGKIDAHQVATNWNRAFPQYQISLEHLKRLLAYESGYHLVACSDSEVTGVAVSFISYSTGYVSALFVQEEFRRKGIGSSLLQKVLEHLSQCKSVKIGSLSPRFWPGLPLDIGSEAENFFNKHGFISPSDAKIAKDLYLDLEQHEDREKDLQLARERGFSFSRWCVEGQEECLKRQHSNFENPAWLDAYEILATKELHNQVMVAYNGEGRQVAWTLMLESGMPLWNSHAFPQLIGDKTGLIACVGTDSACRGMGIGKALIASALQDLKLRGMKHVFVDWVTLPNFYESLGFQVWRRYKQLNFKENR